MSALVLATVVAFAWTASVRTERILFSEAGTRIQATASTLAGLFGQGAARDYERSRQVAADTAVQRYLISGGDPSRARRALAILLPAPPPAGARIDARPQVGAAIDLRRLTGEVALDTSQGGPPPDDWLRQTLGARPDRPAHSPMLALRDSLYLNFFTPVTRGSQTIGYLTSRSYVVTVGAQSLRDLIGTRAVLLLGTPGGIWSDLERPRAAPPPFKAGTPTAYESVAWGDGVGVALPIQSTPWILWVAQPRAILLAPMRRLWTDMGLLALVFITLGIAGSVIVSRRIARPVMALTAAAERVASSEEPTGGPLVAASAHGDEVARLVDAFTRMSSRVVQSRRALEEQVEEAQTLAEELEATNAELEENNEELKTTQVQLDERERHFRRVFESSMIGIVFWDANGEIADANDAFLGTVGYTTDEMRRGEVHWREMTPREWLPSDERALAEIAARGKCTPFEKEYFRKDGTRVPVLIGASSFDGVSTRGIAFVADISDLSTAQAALRASERSLSTTLDSIGDAVIATDLAGRIVRINPVAERLTGWSKADAIGRPLPTVFHIINETTRQPLENPVDLVLRRGTVVGLANHTLLVARDGTELPIADSGAPIRDDAQHTSGVVLVFRDQTEERKVAALRMDALRAEVESRRAQEASRLKSEFVANMSHELRTPLNAIIGFSEILHNKKVAPTSPEHDEYLGDVLTSARHLLQLINDVLDLSKVEAGKLEFFPERVELPGLVAEVLGVLRSGIAEKKIQVESRVDAALTDVHTDAARLKQVLYNYVSNAVKFTPAGGRIDVRVLAEGFMFRLDVSDTGIGIAPKDIDRLFTVFEQLESGTGKRHGGTGLGLALVKRLVEAQGGTVGVTSALGEGATFFAVLPRRPVGA